MERSASWASDEASRRGPADGLSLRVGDWNSGTLFTAASRLPAMWVWFLRKNPAAIAVDWDTSANRAARFCAICCRSGAGHGAQSTAVAQQVLSPRHAARQEDRESGDGSKARRASVLEVASGLGLRSVRKVRFARGRARKSSWSRVNHRRNDWVSRSPLTGEFEVGVIMIAVRDRRDGWVGLSA
jgi:hypothetical protein